MAYFEGLGVPLKTERGNRVFPVSDRAEDIVQALQKAVQRAGIPVVHGDAAHLILEQGRCLGVRTADGREFRAGTTLLATGGLSYPKTGSDGTGYRLAEEAGHTIVPPMPSLIPLVTKENWCRDAMGLSLRNVTLRLYRGENASLKIWAKCCSPTSAYPVLWYSAQALSCERAARRTTGWRST